MTKPDLIRDARLEDLPRIVEIYNLSIPGGMATADTEPVSVESRQAWFMAHQPQHYPIWVLERNRHSVAWISLSAFYGRPAYRATAEFSIYVTPTHQRQGIGSFLLQAMIQHCPKVQITTLLGFIFAHNLPSLQMSTKAGFEQWGLLPEVAELDGQLRDLVVMGRKV